MKAVRRVDFSGGVQYGNGKERVELSSGGLQVEATPVKKSPFGIFGSRDEGDASSGGMDLVGGKSIYDAWNDDDYEELA